MDRVGARRAHEQGAVGHPDPDGHAARPGRRGPGAPRADPEQPAAGPGPVVRDLTLTAHAAARTSRHRGEARAPAPPGVRHPRGPRRRDDGERARRHRAGPVRRPALAAGAGAARQQRLRRQGVRARPAAARSRRSGTSARGTPATTTGTPSDRRQNWRDLPRGLPQAQAAKQNGHNGGKDQFGRTVLNPAGIDLADGMFWDALGLKDNAWVTVDYLWTGDSPLGTVRVRRPGGPAQRAGREGSGRRRWPPTGPPSPCSA